MKGGLVFSASAHAALIMLGLFGLSFGEPLEPEPVESIAVDLVPIEEFANIRQGTLESEIIETETPSAVQDDQPAELAQPTGNTEEDQPTPEQAPTPSPAPTTNTAPENQPEPEPDPVPEQTEAPAPVDPAPTRPEPTPEPPPPEPAPPEPAPEPAPEPTPEPAPTPETETPELTAPTETAEPAVVAPAPVARMASLEQKREEFKKQQEAKKKAAEDEKKKKEEEAERQRVAEAERKKEDAAKAAEAKRKEEEAAKAAEAKRSQQSVADIADEISDIINDEDSRGGTTGQGGEPTVGKPTGQAATLSNSEIAALGAQIRECLSVPLGVPEAGIVVTLQFSVDASGAVTGRPMPVQQPASGLEQTFASAAQRAVMRCGPYAIVAGQDVRVLFDPNQF